MAEMENAFKIVVEKRQVIRQFRRPRCRRKGNRG